MHKASTRVSIRLTLIGVLFAPATALGDVLTVSQWGVGYDTINGAIDDAVDGDVIQVEMGIYNENVNYDGKNIAIMSASGPEVTTILGTSKAVEWSNGETDEASLDGFTVTSYGTHALYFQESTPVVSNCIISDNNSYSAYVYYLADPTFESCTFENNSGSYPVYVYYYASATFSDCTFQDTTATHGGGIYVSTASHIDVDDCAFLNNSATTWGGAIHSYTSTMNVTDSYFEGNTASNGTLVLYQTSGPTTVRNNTFFLNENSYGGAIYVYDSQGYISDNLMVENIANTAGGAFYLDGSSRASILNNTMVNNISYGYGAGVYATSSVNTLLANNIIAHATNGEGIYTTSSSSRLQMVHNDVYDHDDGNYGGYFGDQTGRHGNLSVGPEFVAYSYDGDLSNDDLSLAEGSPLIDAGAPDLDDADGSVSDIGWAGGDDTMDIPEGYDWVVSQLGNGDFTNITDAVAAASHGDRILGAAPLSRRNTEVDRTDRQLLTAISIR